MNVYAIAKKSTAVIMVDRRKQPNNMKARTIFCETELDEYRSLCSEPKNIWACKVEVYNKKGRGPHLWGQMLGLEMVEVMD